MKADELWEKHSKIEPGWQTIRKMNKDDFLAALAEYGKAVRDRDAEICKQMFRHWVVAPTFTVTCPTANDCAAAISREPMP